MFFGRRKFTKLPRKVVVFTMHKAGSMVLHRVLKDICEHNTIRYHSENQPDPDKLPVKKIFAGKDYIWKHNGCFGPIRFFLPTRGLEQADVLLHLRDPRDVLTSMYYSYCFMHRGPVPGNTGMRKEVADAGIDKFVLAMSSADFVRYEGDYGTGGNYKEEIGNLLERYQRYVRELVGRSNVTVVSYEEMVLDFPSWLRKVVDRFELAGQEETYSFVKDRHAEEVKPAEENVWSHKRKVIPGDYREKLQPQTIEELNKRFSEVLDVLGYSDGEYVTRGIPRLRRSVPVQP